MACAASQRVTALRRCLQAAINEVPALPAALCCYRGASTYRRWPGVCFGAHSRLGVIKSRQLPPTVADDPEQS